MTPVAPPPVLTSGDIRQLAGLLEGEGSFRYTTSPVVKLAMTDRDVIDQARAWMGHDRHITHWGTAPTVHVRTRVGRKTIYTFTVCGPEAAGWMMMLFQFMGARRQQQIRVALAKWRVAQLPKWRRTHCPRGHPYDSVRKTGIRGCKECNRVRGRARYERLRVRKTHAAS